GNILLRGETPIQPDDNAGTLTARLALLGAELLVRTLDGVFDGTMHEVVQDGTHATVTKKIRKHHGLIDWSLPAIELERRIRAMTPWPSAYTFHHGRRLQIDAAVVAPREEKAAPGTILSLKPLLVACGEGALEILMLRPEGRRSMTPVAFRAGHPIEPGEVLGASASD
ncbi:MAG TPA: methionyl-tRNA formyltransferase, partial [Candidatus Krumholzibacteria bacterium]|nr:methionyl-tRNA formyltransferase [Candidatus Krumholzibacteria bacterium]